MQGVYKDDDDLLNASVEVNVSAIVLQLVHLKKSKTFAKLIVQPMLVEN